MRNIAKIPVYSSVQITQHHKRLLKILADADRRSMAAQLEVLIDKAIQEKEEVDASN